MKNEVFLVIFLLIPILTFSQKLDLIVTTSGDSIAVKIDTVTQENIVFKLKNHNSWVRTLMLRDSIADYQFDTIQEDQFLFRAGTSYIKKWRRPGTPRSIYDIRKNAVINESIFFNTYERIFPVAEYLGIMAKGGIMIFDPFFPFAEISMILPGPRHFAEFGLGMIYITSFAPTFRVGYRFQSFKGLLLKFSIIGAPTEGEWAPLLGLGFAF